MTDDKKPTPPETDSEWSIMEFLEARGGGKAQVALRQDESVPVLRPIEGRTETGKYQLQGEIARGGVGVVLKGHDTELGRDVAFKVIREEHEDNPDVIHRFVEEAQIGGQLQHPGVVPVYDLGLREGRPFFTMKLVKGRTLAKLLEERVETRRGLLAIFEAVCQTMAYAHTRGVIHRDLKPANVMVGAFGEVHVVDWGMGKVLKSGGVEDERRAIQARTTVIATIRSEPGSVGSQSLVGSVIGTPAYMPPEQAMGEIDRMDERSDVFSLGAILAEILTGQPPYPGTGVEVLQRAAQGDLEPCRRRIAECDADDELKAIANQCLIAAPEARPRDGGEVQARIGAYLAGLEEKARAAQVEAAEERIRVVEAKRKQRLTLALAASIVLTFVLGGGGWWWIRNREQTRAAARREQFQTLVLAAGRATDPAAALAATARARDVLAPGGVAMPATALADLTRIETEAKAARDRAILATENAALLTKLQALRGPGADDERFVIDWPETDRRYGAVFREVGLAPDAGTVEEAAAALAARGETDALAGALDDWTFARREAKNADGARRLADVATRLDGDGTRAKLRAGMLLGDLAALEELAAAVDPAATEPQTLHLLGESLRRLASPETAHAFYRKAYDAHPGDFFLAHGLARASFLAVSQVDALRSYLVAYALRPDDYVASVELAQQYINAREYDRAEAFLRDFLAAKPDDAVLHAELGLVLQNRGSTHDAEAEFQEAIRLDGEQAWCRRMYANFLGIVGRPAEAVEQAQRSVELAPDLADAHGMLGWSLLRQRRVAEALGSFQRALELGPRNQGAWCGVVLALGASGRTADALAKSRAMLAEFPHDVNMQRAGAQQLIAFGKPDAALELLRAALAEAEAKPRPDPSQLASLHLLAANAHEARGEAEAASAERRHALATAPTEVSVHMEIGGLLMRRGKVEEAIPVLQRVVVLEPRHFEGRRMLASALAMSGRQAEALPHQEKAAEIDPTHALAHGAVAEALLALGRAKEALPWADRAVELGPDVPNVHFARAAVLDALGRNEEALEEISKPQVILPPPILALSGRLKGKLGRREEAIKELNAALQLAPTYYPALETLAGLLLDENRTEQALAVVERGVAAAPEYAGSHFQLAIVLQRLGRLDRAESEFQRGLEIDNSIGARLLAAELPAVRGEPEESLQRLRALVAAEPDNSVACGSLAWALATYPLARRNADEALSLAQRVLKKAPDTPRNTLAATLFRAGRHEEAEREFATVFEKGDNGHGCVAYLRAMNLRALGRLDEAKHWYEEAERRVAQEGKYPWPDHVWLRAEAARVFAK